MKGTGKRFGWVAAIIWVSTAAQASADPVQPVEGLTLDVGGGLVTRPKFLGSSDYSADFAPVLEARLGRDLRLSLDDGVSWTPLHIGGFSAGPVVEFRQSFNAVRLTRGPRSSDTFEAGAVLKAETPIGDLEARLRHGLGGDQLVSGDITFDTLFPVYKKTFVGLGAHGSWANEAFSLPARRIRGRLIPLQGEHDYYAIGIQGSAIYEFNDSYRAAIVASFDRLITPDEANLSLSTHNIFSLGLVFTRRFRWARFGN